MTLDRMTLERMTEELPHSLLLPSIRFATELVNLTYAGDLAAARSLALGRPETLFLGIQTELLTELTIATGSPEPRESVTALLREAASEPHLAAWLERAAPALVSEARSIAQNAPVETAAN